MRVFSSGGGVQSTAVLVLAAQGIIEYDAFVWANVGDDSEMPDSLKYIREVAMPYAKRHGINYVETQKRRGGRHEKQTLYKEIYRRERNIPIPVWMETGAPGNRGCTINFKIRVVDKWISENGGRGHAVTLGLGISVDEIRRARPREPEKVHGFTKLLEYPLIDMGISRSQCFAIVASAGLPTPPRSACWFCPYKTPTGWIRLKREYPDLFQKAVDLEKHIQEKRLAMGRDIVWLHSSLRPLEVTVGDQYMMFSKTDEWG